MTDRTGVPSPQAWARVGGVLYLIIIVIGFLGEVFVRGTLIVQGNATATLDNIRSSEALWRAGIAGNLFLLACAVPLAVVFYVLLRPVNRDLALLALLFNLVAITLEAASLLHLLPTLFVLGQADYLRAFQPEQLSALAYLSTRSHGHGFGMGLLFFGFECLVLGYLIFKSRYLPGVLGVLMQIAGVCYLLNSFALILAPALASRIVPAVLIPPFLGELSLCLWLLVKGVNMPRWHDRASGSGDFVDGRAEQ